MPSRRTLSAVISGRIHFPRMHFIGGGFHSLGVFDRLSIAAGGKSLRPAAK